MGITNGGGATVESTDKTLEIEELKKEIALLPAGSVSTKKIRGKNYYYHRVTVGGRRTETYVDFDKADELRAQIEKRKELEAKLKELKRSVSPKPGNEKGKVRSGRFKTYVRIGNELLKMASPVKNYRRRECFGALRDYVFGEQQDKVFILYGLRRTGKTTMIRQIILEMTPEQREKAAFLQISQSNTLSQVNADMRLLEENGFEYVFIDEVTLMKDFIEGAAVFSDIYAASGMKIILSGTDSLGFVFTEQDQLYDRCIMLHTTFIPYREFENVLGIKGIDEYIRYGGTMSASGVNYNEKSTFATKKSADIYINTAIARNIQHSLEYYQDGGHFRMLYELYKKGELTSAINRVVEDMNHRFTKEVLTRTFRSGDLSVASRNLLRDRNNPVDLESNIDREKVERSLKTMMDILDKEEQSVEIDETHASQIKEYLSLLDLVTEIDQIYLPETGARSAKPVFSQPGMRYALAESLVNSLIIDEKFGFLDIADRQYILERLLDTVRGFIMEEIVLLETKIALPLKEVYHVQFALGEFDMVVYDPATLSCSIYEIKHSKELVPEQYRHLIDKSKCAAAEHRFGKITGKYVIYRGDPAELNGIHYLNVEEYLKNFTRPGCYE
ncbi:MAG: AAA family ATPase [Clostridia bacterium]|nr:AAA family ATPase [Clostridia bacterium]